MNATELSRLSALLDRALDMTRLEREAWLDALQAEGGEQATLGESLRLLLATRASRETADLLERGVAFVPPRTGPAAGDLIGPYRLVSELGRGGMSWVWLAERSDGSLARQVALKLPHVGWAPGLAERFRRERQILASLEHPHIARLYDAGVDDLGRPWMALERVQGRPIDAYCREQGLAPRARLALMLQVVQAVAFAHGRLVVHRDLKPANILVTAAGEVRLLDFGIAKLLQGDPSAGDGDQAGAAAAPAESPATELELTRAGARVLTPAYAAPEQIAGGAIGTATDIFALGVLLYELLAGVRPFHGAPHELERAVLHEDPPRPPSLPADLGTVILKALKKAPAERYASADALHDDLARWLAGEPVRALPDSAAYRMRKFVGRHRVGVAVSAAAVGVVCAAALVSLRQAQRAEEAAARARAEARTAEAVQAFLEELLRGNRADQADPQRARQRSVRDVLDEGLKRFASGAASGASSGATSGATSGAASGPALGSAVGSTLASASGAASGAFADAAGTLAEAPGARFRVLRTLADMSTDIGEWERSMRLNLDAAAHAERDFGAGDARVALALAEAVVAGLDAGAMGEIPALLERAAAIVKALRPPPADVELAVTLAQAHHARYAQDASGLPHAERAVSLAAAPGVPPARRLASLQLLGTLQRLAGQLEASAKTLEQALSLVPSLGGGLNIVSGLHQELSFTTERLGELARAETHMREALAIETRLAGAESSPVALVLRQLARLLADQGRLGEAIALYQRQRETMQRWPASGEKTQESVVSWMFEARAWRDAGHARRALAASAQALALMPDPAAYARVAAVLRLLRSQAHADLGLPEAAARDLEEMQALMQRHDLRAGDLRTLRAQQAVRLELEQGRVPEARRRLDAARAEAGPLAHWLAPTDVELLLVEGRPAEALAQARALLAARTTAARHQRGLRLAAGRAHLALGQVALAVQEIDAAAALAAALPHAGQSLALAQVRAAQAEAALVRGHRSQAAKFLAEAGAAFRHQAPVGGTVSLPLERLQERLAAR